MKLFQCYHEGLGLFSLPTLNQRNGFKHNKGSDKIYKTAFYQHVMSAGLYPATSVCCQDVEVIEKR